MCISKNITEITQGTQRLALLVPNHLLEAVLSSVGVVKSNKYRSKKTFRKMVGGRAVGRPGEGQYLFYFH